MSINRVNISGNMTRDPELRSTAGGMAVLQFGVAVNDRRKNNQTGEWEDKPNFVDCVMFGNRAEAVSGYLSKGMKVSIEGKLSYSAWNDKQTGQKRSKLEVLVDEIEFMTAGQKAGAPSQVQPSQPPYPPQQYAPQPAPAQYQQGYAPAQPYQQQGAQVAPQPYQQPAPQPVQPQPAQPPMQHAGQQVQQTIANVQQQMHIPGVPVVDASSAIYDEDIPF